MDLGEMQTFVRVVELGGFTAAAREADVSPSSASRQVARLEDRLGVRLLNRTTRQISLTEAGTIYLNRAKQILADIEETESLVSQSDAGPRGTLRVEVPVSFGRLHVMPALPELLARHPDLRVDVTLHEHFVDIVEAGVDVAIRIGELRDSSLVARRLASNRRLVCGSPSYFETYGRPERPADLVHHNCLVYTYRALRNEWRFTGPDGEEMVHVTGRIEANSAEALHAALCAGEGLGLLPLWLVGPELENGTLEPALKGYQASDSAIYAVFPPGRHLSPKVRVFVDFLAERFRNEAFWRAAD